MHYWMLEIPSGFGLQSTWLVLSFFRSPLVTEFVGQATEWLTSPLRLDEGAIAEHLRCNSAKQLTLSTCGRYSRSHSSFSAQPK